MISDPLCIWTWVILFKRYIYPYPYVP